MDRERINSMGWNRDLPDVRDLTAEAPGVDKVLSQSGKIKAVKKALPPDVDLRKWCSPIEDQGELGSCTANAGVGLLEYFERRTYRKTPGCIPSVPVQGDREFAQLRIVIVAEMNESTKRPRSYADHSM